MQLSRQEQIGNVYVKYIMTAETARAIYSDGPAENKLYRMFEKNVGPEEFAENHAFGPWAMHYHLSPVRHNLLKWYPFGSKASLLEIGAGCGALTGLFCDRVARVVALEYSRRRALITALRFSKQSNLELIVGGLQDFETPERFDYVTVIGVLEYAAEFYGGESPYESFLKKVSQLLKPQGLLILAIENKIGLKYITGAPEDHTGRIFDSIYDYPNSIKVRTFAKKELSSLLETAGFTCLKWYYPLPDYKLPQAVLSEPVNLSDTDSLWSLFPAKTGGSPRKEILSEKLLGQTLAQAGLFGEFANSFLVVAGKQETEASVRCLRFYGADQQRKPEYRTNVLIRVENHEKMVIKSADNPKAEEFVREIAAREILSKQFFAGKAQVVTAELHGSSLAYPYLEWPTLEELIAQAIKANDAQREQRLLNEYLQFVRNLPARECAPHEFMREFGAGAGTVVQPIRCLDVAPLDCIPRNIAVAADKWYVLDAEWTYNFPMPVDFLIFRAIYSLVCDLQIHIQRRVSTQYPVVLLCGFRHPHYIPLNWLAILNSLETPRKQLSKWNARFQRKVLVRQSSHTRIRLTPTPKVLTKVEVNETKARSALPYYLRRLMRNIVSRARRAI